MCFYFGLLRWIKTRAPRTRGRIGNRGLPLLLAESVEKQQKMCPELPLGNHSIRKLLLVSFVKDTRNFCFSVHSFIQILIKYSVCISHCCRYWGHTWGELWWQRQEGLLFEWSRKDSLRGDRWAAEGCGRVSHRKIWSEKYSRQREEQVKRPWSANTFGVSRICGSMQRGRCCGWSSKSQGSMVRGNIVEVTKSRPHRAWWTTVRRLGFTLSVTGSCQMALIRGMTCLCLDIPVGRQPNVMDLLDSSVKVLASLGVFGPCLPASDPALFLH